MRAPLRIACIVIAVGSLAAAGRAQQTPDTYGTAVESYVRVPAVAFQPYRGVDGPVYTTGDGISGLGKRTRACLAKSGGWRSDSARSGSRVCISSTPALRRSAASRPLWISRG